MPRDLHPARFRPAPPETRMPRKKVLVIGSLGWSLVNFRLDLMRRMIANGHEVLAAAPDLEPAIAETLRAAGIRPIRIPMERTGLNPLADLRCLRALHRVMATHRPDLVLPYTMKPIIWGCLAARLAGIPAVPIFTGLGYAFCEDNPRGKRRLVRAISVHLHRLATRKASMAFYYNSAEQRDIRRFRLMPRRAQLVAVPGSGVDTARFAPSDPPEGPPGFLFVGRLLRSKGVEDLLAAAQLLRQEGLTPRVELLGPTDSNPDALPAHELECWHEEGMLVWHGATRDVRPYLAGASVLVLPTRLREGVPRTILEAMACARAVITTDAPGCGETLADGESGLVVPVGDVPALAAAMRRFIDTPGLAREMGRAARARVLERNDVHRVNRLLLTRLGLESPLSAPESAHPESAHPESAHPDSDQPPGEVA